MIAYSGPPSSPAGRARRSGMSVPDDECRSDRRRHRSVRARRPPIPARQGTSPRRVKGQLWRRPQRLDAAPRLDASTTCQPKRRALVPVALDPPPTPVADASALGFLTLPAPPFPATVAQSPMSPTPRPNRQPELNARSTPFRLSQCHRETMLVCLSPLTARAPGSARTGTA